MAIVLNGKTKLTTEVERLLIELGGADPSKTFSREELSQALVSALEALPEDSSFLRKLCGYFESHGLLDEFIDKSATSESLSDQ